MLTEKVIEMAGGIRIVRETNDRIERTTLWLVEANDRAGELVVRSSSMIEFKPSDSEL